MLHRARGAVGLIVLAACSHAAAPTAPGRASDVTVEISGQRVGVPRLFAHVPADAMIVAGSFEPPPLDYFERWRDMIGPQFEQGLTDAKTDDDRRFVEVYKAAMTELGGKLTAAGWQAAGMSTSMRFALYATDGAGVIRLEIDDAAKVRRAMEHIAAAAHAPLPTPTTMGPYTVWQFPPHEKDTNLIAIGDGELVVAADRTDRIATSLPVLVGTQLPAHNLGDGKAIADELTSHGFHAGFFGLLDLHAAVASSKEEKPACQALMLRFTEQVPRLVMGTGEMNAQRLTVGFGVDLQPDTAARFTGLSTAAAPLDELLRSTPDGEPAIAATMGVNLEALRHLIADFAEPTAQYADACDGGDKDDLRHKVAELLAFQIPPQLAGLTGGGFAIYDISMSDGAPKAVDAVLAASGDTAGQAMNWLASIVGQPAIDADGQVHLLAISGMLPFPVGAGIGPHAAVVVAGDVATATAARILRAPGGATKSPLAAGQMNIDRLHRLIVKLGTETDKDKTTWAQLAEFARFGATIEADAHGLVFWFSADWKPRVAR